MATTCSMWPTSACPNYLFLFYLYRNTTYVIRPQLLGIKSSRIKWNMWKTSHLMFLNSHFCHIVFAIFVYVTYDSVFNVFCMKTLVGLCAYYDLPYYIYVSLRIIQCLFYTHQIIPSDLQWSSLVFPNILAFHFPILTTLKGTI